MQTNNQSFESWCLSTEVSLGSQVIKLLMDPNGEYGFNSVSDLLFVEKKDIDGIVSYCKMSFGEKARFITQLELLKFNSSANNDNKNNAPRIEEAKQGGYVPHLREVCFIPIFVAFQNANLF